MLLNSDGSILLGGITPTAVLDFALARATSDGKLDLTFGTAGLLTTDFRGHHDSAFGMTAYTDGRVVLTGGAGGPRYSDVALAKFEFSLIFSNGFETGDISVWSGSQ